MQNQRDLKQARSGETGDQTRSRTAGGGGYAAWRSVVMPAEHGGWGFVLEPILLGLLIAPSIAALALGFATFAAFLARQPLKIVRIDSRRGLHTPRTQRATRAMWILGALAMLTLAGALWLAGPKLLLPIAMAAPFAMVYVFFDLSRPGRTLQAELSGPLAMASVASAMAMIDGWTLVSALALWSALSLRSVPSVLYVRARIRLDRGRESNVAWPIAMHALALGAAGVLVWAGLLPAIGLFVYALLLARAIWFLIPQRPMVQIQTIGFMELGLGILLVLTLAVGFWIA